MKAVAMIPCRMAASRFPGKPLARISGLTMIEHVFRRCALALGDDNVYIATCDRSIEEVATSFGAKVIMTSDQHVRCTDRIAEAAQNVDADVIINVQGDEPLLDPKTLHELLKPFKSNPGCLASNLIQKMDPKSEDPNSYQAVKVVFNRRMEAMYFSREAIPTPQRSPDLVREYYKQIGVIAFKKSFLEAFSRMEPTPLERAESVDMMRMLEHGYVLDLVVTESRFVAVDVPGDVQIVEQFLKDDMVFKKYAFQPAERKIVEGPRL